MTLHKSIKEILTLLVDLHDLNESELSRNAKVSQPTIHRLLSGATPDPRISTLKLLALYFQVTIGQLVGVEPLPCNEAKPHAKHLVRLPLIPWEQAHQWQHLTVNFAPGNWTYWTASQYANSSQSYALCIPHLHSSAPFTKNTMIVVDPSITLANDQHVVVHRLSDQSITIKKLIFDGDDQWLIPLNEQLKACRCDADHTICGVIIQANMPLMLATTA